MKYGLVVLLSTLWVSLAGQNMPSPKPELHPVSTIYSERDMAISPDGSEMFYTISVGPHVFSAIVRRTKLKRGWSEPVIAPFSGKFKDLEPAFSADGKKIFFSSNRPVPGKSSADFDIWAVEKIDGKWSTEATNLGPPINTDKDEFYPSVTRSGNLYFTAEYSSGIGKEDIWMASFTNGKYSPPVVLDTAINSGNWEFNAFVASDEKYILFTCFGRKDDAGGGDLYVSTRGDNGRWTKARPLHKINSPRLDYCPFVTSDEKTLFFTSQRHGFTSMQEKQINYEELRTLLNNPENGNDNIFWILFDEVLTP